MAKKVANNLWGLLGYNNTRERFSLEELKHLHYVLLRNPVVSDSNRDVVVETLRSIAELMIWGDQHEPKFFEFFLENNLLQHFNAILQQRANRTGDVAKQVLQTLSILIQNIRSTTAIFYLFSNNHINEIVAMRFDFEDDEVLGYYINLAKTVSLKLNAGTVQFFFSDDGERSAFPLYTEAVKFINHRDGMVRAAVRTLTLNVYSIADPAVQRFVISQPASNYFTELAIFTTEQCEHLDRILTELEAGTSTSVFGVDSCLAEIEDLLSYCNDILGTGVPALRDLLLQRMWEAFALPILFWPLISDEIVGHPQAAVVPPDTAHRRTASGAAGEKGRVRPVCSLFVLERLLHVINHTQFLSLLCHSLFAPAGAVPPAPGTRGPVPGSELGPRDYDDGTVASLEPASEASTSGREADMAAAAGTSSWNSGMLGSLKYTPGAYREVFLEIVRGDDVRLAAAAVRVLVAIVNNRSLQAETLDVAGLLPHRRKKNRELLEVLTAPVTPVSNKPDAPPPNLFPMTDDRASSFYAARRTGSAGNLAAMHNPETQPASQQQADARQGDPGAGPSSSETLSGQGGAGDLPLRGQGEAGPSAPRENGSGDVASFPLPFTPDSPLSDRGPPPGSCGDVWVDALCGLLLLELLPNTALWGVGWLLFQLVAISRIGGSSLSELQRRAVAEALNSARAGLRAEFRGMWCDALPVLVDGEWGAARAGLLGPRGQSTNAAVYAWLQACQTQELAVEAQPQQPGGGGGKLPSVSARAAKRAYHAVQRLVGLAQIQQMLEGGDIAAGPPLLPVPEAALKAAEVREGGRVALRGAGMPCSVAFSRGQERTVLFCIEGLPEGYGTPSPAMEQVVTAVPSILLAEAAAPSQPPSDSAAAPAAACLVLSVAPLLGADPALDRAHPRWLHVHVRPPVRGLLKVLKASSHGSAFGAISKQLVDGHWVLAFQDAERAAAACQLVQQHAAKLSALYCNALAPLTDSPTG